MSPASASDQSAPWVLVCGGFHKLGGMDRANLELANALVGQGRQVFLVAHQIDSELAANPLVSSTLIPRPFDSILLGERALRRAGWRIAKEVTRKWPKARVVVNGGNCDWPDINWVHCVHDAWPPFDEDAPLWFRIKNLINRRKARQDEKHALATANLVITNSKRTRRDVIALGVEPDKVHIIYLGSGQSWTPVDEEEKRRARRSFDLPTEANVVGFVGALGYDRNKGFDTLLSAWRRAQIPNSYLLAAGCGRGFKQWQALVRASGMVDRIRLLGFTDRVSDVYAASDVLVSPVRYEAFGLNVQEAICRGIPAIVSSTAGVAELYTQKLDRYLLADPEDSNALAEILRTTLTNLTSARQDFSPLSEQLRSRSWKSMAEAFIKLVESLPATAHA